MAKKRKSLVKAAAAVANSQKTPEKTAVKAGVSTLGQTFTDFIGKTRALFKSSEKAEV